MAQVKYMRKLMQQTAQCGRIAGPMGIPKSSVVHEILLVNQSGVTESGLKLGQAFSPSKQTWGA